MTAVTVSSTGAKNLLQGDDNGHVGRPCEVSPAPPCPELCCELRGLCRHSYFGPRTCGRSKKPRSEVSGSQSGFPKKPFSPLMSNRCLVSSIKMLKTVHQRCVMRMRVSPIDVRVRMGDAIGPFQLANGFEAVIGYECQERSNPLSLILTMHTSHARCDKASEWVGGSLPILPIRNPLRVTGPLPSLVLLAEDMWQRHNVSK